MEKTNALLSFISQDELLEILIMRQDERLGAAKLLSAMIHNKWQITTLEADKILEAVSKEMNSTTK